MSPNKAMKELEEAKEEIRKKEDDVCTFLTFIKHRNVRHVLYSACRNNNELLHFETQVLHLFEIQY